MKSCVTKNVLSIPREIYFSGSPKDILRFSLAFRKKAKSETTRPHIPENHGSQISLCCCALFSHEVKARNRIRSQFSVIAVEIEKGIEVDASPLRRVTELVFNVAFPLSTPPECQWDASYETAIDFNQSHLLKLVSSFSDFNLVFVFPIAH